MAIGKFKKLQDLVVGGAFVTKSTDLVTHARDPTALSGDISGMTQIGVAGATASTMMDVALGFKFHKKKKKK